MGGKQKVVLRVPVRDEKSRSRALKTVVGLSSVSVEGADKNLIVVIGEGIDPAGLTKSLRKKLGDAELVTVAPVEEKKKSEPEKKPDDKDKKPPNKEIPPWLYGPGFSQRKKREEEKEKRGRQKRKRRRKKRKKEIKGKEGKKKVGGKQVVCAGEMGSDTGGEEAKEEEEEKERKIKEGNKKLGACRW